MTDKYEFEILPLFSDVVSITHLKVNNKNILKHLKKLKYKKRHNYEKIKSFISNDLSILNNLIDLELEIKKGIEMYIKNVLMQNTNFRITNSWASKTEPKAFCNKHQHCNSWLSAVYYPEGCGDFKIRLHTPKPKLFLDHIKEYNIYNSSIFDISAEDNMLLIFPSILAHEILINTSKKTRYSIALNIVPQGKILEGTDSQLVI